MIDRKNNSCGLEQNDATYKNHEVALPLLKKTQEICNRIKGLILTDVQLSEQDSRERLPQYSNTELDNLNDEDFSELPLPEVFESYLSKKYRNGRRRHAVEIYSLLDDETRQLIENKKGFFPHLMEEETKNRVIGEVQSGLLKTRKFLQFHFVEERSLGSRLSNSLIYFSFPKSFHYYASGKWNHNKP